MSSFIANTISNWLVERLIASNQKGFVIGVSGGIDSAVVSSLCARTYRPTVCVTLPIHQPPAHVVRANDHIDSLKQQWQTVTSFEVDLTQSFETFKAVLPAEVQSSELSMANLRSRLRMSALYTFAGSMKLLVAGTGNKIEDYGVRFFTKYGDGGVDLSPIGDLTKTQVYAVGKFLGVPESILTAPPTDGLWANDRSDEEQIGATYPELEAAMSICTMFNIETKAKWQAIQDAGFTRNLSPRERAVVGIYLDWHEKGQHKMEMPPVCHFDFISQ